MFDRFGQPLSPVTGAAKTVDAHVNVVAVGLVQGWRGFEIGFVTVNAACQQALFDELAEEVRVGAFSGTHHGTPHRHGVALQVPKDVVHDLLNGAPRHFAATFWAVGFAHAGPQQAQVILNLGDRGHGGAGVVRPLLLVDGNGWRKALDAVAIGFLHLADELARIGGKRFHIPSLTLGVQRVKGQGGFARARNAAHDHKAAAWKANVHVLQVVGPCPTDLNPPCIAWIGHGPRTKSWSTVLESLPIAQVTKGTGASKRTGSSDSG